MRVIDANIIVRILRNDHSIQSPASVVLLTRIEKGLEKVFLPEIVLCDVVWTLRSVYKVPMADIRSALSYLLSIDGFVMHRKHLVVLALDKAATLNIDFSDALITAEMISEGYQELYSYDKDFNRVSQIKRLEP